MGIVISNAAAWAFFGRGANTLAADQASKLADTKASRSVAVEPLQAEPKLARNDHEQPGSAASSSAVELTIVQSMCRCNSGNMPITHSTDAISGLQVTNISQEASLALGGVKRTFLHRKTTCECRQGFGEGTEDPYLSRVQNSYCSPSPADSNMQWSSLPDFGVQQKLPLFLGVLSYKSPKSLHAALNNWQQHGLPSIGLAGTFVQLNARSAQDDAVLAKFNASFNFTVSGNPSENVHPGLAIARFCRAAEQSPMGHPGGENLLLFLEKDWQISRQKKEDLGSIFHSVNTLVQRGVTYVRLSEKLSKTSWQCDAEGLAWDCVLAHQQRYTNLPSVLRCDWFLRYLEPFALIQDSIMFGCRRDARKRRYFDWEEAMQDGRIAWSHTQWVVANMRREGRSSLFKHVEVDS